MLDHKRIAIDGSFLIYKYCATYRDAAGDLFKSRNGLTTAHLYGLTLLLTRLYQRGAVPIFVFEGACTVYKRNESNRRQANKAQAKRALAIALNSLTRSHSLIKRLKQQSFSITQEILQSTKRFLDLAGIAYAYSDYDGQKSCYQLLKDGRCDVVLTDDWDICAYGGRVIRRLQWVEENGEYRPIGQYIDIEQQWTKNELTRLQVIRLICIAGCDYTPGLPGYGPLLGLKLAKSPAFSESPFCKTVVEPIAEYMLSTAQYLSVYPAFHKLELYNWLTQELSMSPQTVYKLIKAHS